MGEPSAKNAVGLNSRVGYLIKGRPVPDPTVYDTILEEFETSDSTDAVS
jgi:hypothetical protein